MNFVATCLRPGERLLRRALHALSSRMHVIVVILHAGAAAGTAAFPCGVDGLEGEVIDHGVRGRCSGGSDAGRENGFEGLDLLFGEGSAVFATEALGELDVELDVEVSVVVVAV